MPLNPLIINDSPPEFRPFLEAADNYAGSDNERGVIKSEQEAEGSLEKACGFPLKSAYKDEAQTCLNLIDYLKDKAGYAPNGIVSYFRGYAYFVQRKDEEAGQNFDKAIGDKVKVAEAYFGKGTIFSREKKLDEAKAFFEKAVEVNPNYASAYAMLGYLALTKNNTAELEANVDKALELDPRDLWANVLKGSILLSKGKFENAEVHLRNCLKIDGRDGLVLAGLASSILEQIKGESVSNEDDKKRAEEALKFAEESVKFDHDPNNALPFFVRGHALRKLGRLEEALSDYQKAREAKDRSKINEAALYSDMGLTLYRLGRAKEAVEALNKAAELEPTLPETNSNFYSLTGDSYVALGKFREAAECYKKAAELQPSIEVYRKEVTSLLMSGGDPDEAIKCLDKALSLCQTKGCKDFVQIYKADVLTAGGRYHEALSILSQMTDIEGAQKKDYYFLMSVVLFMLGRKKEASIDIEKVKESGNGAAETAILKCITDLKNDPQGAIDRFELDVKRLDVGGVKINLSFTFIQLWNLIASYSGVIKGAVKDPEIALYAGYHLLSLNMPNEAMLCLDKAIELAPDDYHVYMKKGDVLYKLQRFDEAVTAYKKAVELEVKLEKEGKDAHLYLQYGLALDSADHHQEAIEQFDKAQLIDPELHYPELKKCLATFSLKGADEGLACADEMIKKYPDEGEAYRVKAELLFQNGKVNEALAPLKKALELSPGDPAVQKRAGVIYFRSHDYAAAAESYTNAIALEPYNGQLYIRNAVCLIELSRSNEAEELISSVVKDDKERSEAYTVIAEVFLNQQQYEEAMEWIEKAINLNKDEKTFYAIKSLALIGIGKVKEGEELAEDILKEDGGNAVANYAKGIALAEGGGYEEALAFIDKALMASPEDNVFLLFNKGRLLFLLNRYEEALGYLTKVIGIGSDAEVTAAACYLRGITYNEMGRYQEALADLKRSSEMAADKEFKQDIYYKMGLVFINVNDLDGAEDVFLEMIDEDPNSAAGNYGLAVVTFKSGLYEAADGTLDDVIKLAPSMPEPYNDKALIRIQQGKMDEALKFLDEAIRRKNDFIIAHRNKIKVLINMGRYKDAQEAVEKGLKIEPGDYALLYLKGAIDLFSGDLPNAMGALQASLKSNPMYLPARLALVQAFLSSNDINSAVVEIDQILKDDPNNYSGYLLKGQVLLEDMKDYAGAVDVFEKLRDIYPKDPTGAYFFAKSHFMLGNYDKAAGVLDATVLDALGVSDPYVIKAMIEERFGRYEKALEYLEKAVKIGEFIDPKVLMITEDMVGKLRSEIKANEDLKKKLDAFDGYCKAEKEYCEKVFRETLPGPYGEKVEKRVDCFRTMKLCGEEVPEERDGTQGTILPRFESLDGFQYQPSPDPFREHGPYRGPFGVPPSTIGNGIY